MNEEIMARISDVQARYAEELMKKANVVGVGVGLKQTEGQFTETLALVVLVEKKLPLEELKEEDLLPKEIEGVPIDVQETGGIFAN
jgi:hypothetical protein